MQTSAHSSAQLARRLGFWSAIGIVVGVTIGSGIFRTPASIASRVPDPTLMLGVWLAGRIDFARRRAVGGRAGRVAAADGRLVRLPARRMGTPRRVSLRLVGARAHQGVGERRHLDGLQRIPVPVARLRPGRVRARQPTTSRPPRSSPRRSSTSAACSSARSSPARPASRSSAPWPCSCSRPSCSEAAPARPRATSPPRRAPWMPGCSASP